MVNTKKSPKKKVNTKDKLPKVSGKEMRIQRPHMDPAVAKSINDSMENAARIYKGMLDTESMRNFMKQAAEIQKIAQNYFDSPGYIYFKKFLEEQQKERERLSRAIDAISPTLYKKPEDWIYAAPQRKAPVAMSQEDREGIKREVSEIMRDFFREFIGEIEAEKIMRNKKPWQIVINFTRDGDLCYGEGHYELKSEGNRIKVVSALIGEKDFVKTEALRKQTGYKNNESLRDAIKEINNKARKRLGIDHNLIEGKTASGYRINSKYYFVVLK